MPQDSTLTTSQSVPGNVAQAAAAAGLGALVRVHVPKRRNWFAIAFGLLLGLATTIILVGFWLLWEMFRTPNLSKAQAARRIFVHQQGFVILDRPEDPQVFRWDAVDTVFQQIVSRRAYGIETARTYLYTVTRRDGYTVKITQFWDGVAELGPAINQCVSQALMPGAMAAIERGHGVQFGDMTLTATGISGARKQVTWPEVSKITIANGYVRVGVAGRFLALSNTASAKIPNLPLFLTLAERLRTGGR